MKKAQEKSWVFCYLTGLHSSSRLPTDEIFSLIIEAMKRDRFYFGESNLATLAASAFLEIGEPAKPFLAKQVDGYKKNNLLRVLGNISP